jgi:hypothetical protein
VIQQQPMVIPITRQAEKAALKAGIEAFA